MNADERQLQEIREHEVWLRSQGEAAAEISTSAIKERVRIELAGRWLDRRLTSDEASSAATRAKETVRSELAKQRTRRLHRRLFAFGTAGLGLAALWAFVWLSPLAATPSAHEFTYVAAFEQFSGSDLDAAIDSIGGETNELDEETAFVFDDAIGAEFYVETEDPNAG